jgi:hypothetical protein
MWGFALAAAAVIVGTATRPAVDDAFFRSRILEIHNSERAAVGSQPLVWSEALAGDAAVWGSDLARRKAFEHDPGNRDQGENLWMGTRGHYSLDEMLHGWVEEKPLLRRMSSWEDDYHAVGHYTQMVWSTTRSVGCAITHSASDEYLTCRYDPPGNVMGDSPYVDGGMSVPIRR